MDAGMFSPWTKWDSRVEKLELKSPGIYALKISKTNIEGKPFKFEKAIVYFGMTVSVAGLKGRLSQFNNTLRDKSGGQHGGAERFRHDYPKGETVAKMLYVAVRPFECDVKLVTEKNLLTQGDIVRAEYEALAEYVKRFGKQPKYNDKKMSPKWKRAHSPS